MSHDSLSMIGLSKSRLLAHRQCPRRLWLQVRQPGLSHYDAGAEHRFAVGHSVGEVARRLYPEGHLVETESLTQALRDTIDYLIEEQPQPIFEATFEIDRVLVSVDLMLPSQDRWRMVEVKSSTSVKPYHLSDATVQSWVLNRVGVGLASVEIAHIDNSFVYPGGGDYAGLFHHADITRECAELEADVPGWIEAARATLAGADPKTPPGPQCHDPFECPFLSHCVPETADKDLYPPSLLPYAGTLAEELSEEGYSDIREIPEGRLTNSRHIRIWQATCEGQAILYDEAADLLEGLSYPRYYMDFDTIQFAVPIWEGTRPYAQLPFQWSCHVESTAGELEHHEYLAEDAEDPRRAFAESLLASLGEAGPIMVYNAAFERTRLIELARDFPELAQGLLALVERLIDLLPIAHQHYYHPDMRGSWSIKAVLPTIAPELAYDELTVGDGGMAQEAYLEMIHSDTPPERKAALREALLEYCERDTLAMVRVAHHFEKRG